MPCISSSFNEITYYKQTSVEKCEGSSRISMSMSKSKYSFSKAESGNAGGLKSSAKKDTSASDTLIIALATTIFKKQVSALDSLRETVVNAVRGVQKILEPLPPGFPPGPSGDSLVDLASEPLGFLTTMKEKYGGAVGLKLAGERAVLISEPSLAKQVLVTKADIFVKAGTAFFPGSSLAGNGLLVSDGEIWKKQRRLSNPAFRKSAIDTYAQAMVEATESLLNDKWLPKKGTNKSTIVRDIYSDFNDLTMEIVATALFGGSKGSGGYKEVGPAITTAFAFFTQRATTMMIIPEWIPTPDNIQYLSAVKKLDEVVYRLIDERRKQLQANMAEIELAMSSKLGSEGISTGKTDLLTRLLAERDEDGSGMDDVALRDELMTLLVAGQETSAILLSWACAMMAANPDVKKKMADEVEEVLQGRLPTHADTVKLRYVESVVWETMRLLPPAYIVGRCASLETKLGQWNVPAGTTVFVSPYLLHRDEASWPRAELFDPERWMPGGDAIPHKDNNAYWPFGGGPRNCIGMGFAMMEVILVLAIIVQRREIFFGKGQSLPEPKPMITLRPESRVNLTIKAVNRLSI